MKLTRLFTLMLAAAGLLALAAPAEAQSRGNRGGGNNNRGNMNRGDGNHGNFNRGGHGRFGRGGPRVNFYFGGYPYYGYPYYGYGYGYGYGSPYYGYPYGYTVRPYYTYDPRGIYEGRVVNEGQPRQRTNDGGGKDLSMNQRVQQQLAAAGYYRGEIDGVIGDGTRRAIRSCERDNGLQVDGRIDRELLSTLGLS